MLSWTHCAFRAYFAKTTFLHKCGIFFNASRSDRLSWGRGGGAVPSPPPLSVTFQSRGQKMGRSVVRVKGHVARGTCTPLCAFYTQTCPRALFIPPNPKMREHHGAPAWKGCCFNMTFPGLGANRQSGVRVEGGGGTATLRLNQRKSVAAF